MMYKVLMGILHVAADDNFLRHDERGDLRVFFSAQEPLTATSLSVHMHQCQNLPLAASLGLLVPACGAKALVNFTQVYAASSSTEGRADSMLANPEQL